MVDWATVLPASGIAGALVFVIFYLLNSNRQDRDQSRAEREEARKAMRELREEHGKELADLRGRVDQLEAELDNERKLRIAAEATAASERLRATAAEHQITLMRLATRGRHDDESRA